MPKGYLPPPTASPPLRALTRGPGYHWFGYYDKRILDPSGCLLLAMAVDFDHRSPRPDDAVKVGMLDLSQGERWLPLGESRAWNWHQGCMLQWLPGSAREVIWNDRQGDRLVSHIADIDTGTRRTLPTPIYTLSPNGQHALAVDFRRINEVRPGHGYGGLSDPQRDRLVPEESGIWQVDLASGETKLVIAFADVLSPDNKAYSEAHNEAWLGAKHWFNHLLFNPDGSRFVFLHRWRTPAQGQAFGTRMLSANPDGGRVHVVDPFGNTAHFTWRDPSHLLAWAYHPSHGQRFYLYQDRSDNVTPVAGLNGNGHCSYLPGGRFVLSDTYPDLAGYQTLYLYDTTTQKRHDLGAFRQPDSYRDEWRCDLHPRASPDGCAVIIDSAHEGNGRQLYWIDIQALTT